LWRLRPVDTLKGIAITMGSLSLLIWAFGISAGLIVWVLGLIICVLATEKKP
jgi:hypothetical protein